MTGDRKPRIVTQAREAFSKSELRSQRKSETRLESVRKSLKAHCARHKPVWIARESMRLIQKRLRPGFAHPAPFGARQSTDLPAITRQARGNVEARITRRLSRLNTIARTRQQNRTQKTADKQSLRRAFSNNSRMKL